MLGPRVPLLARAGRGAGPRISVCPTTQISWPSRKHGQARAPSREGESVGSLRLRSEGCDVGLARSRLSSARHSSTWLGCMVGWRLATGRLSRCLRGSGCMGGVGLLSFLVLCALARFFFWGGRLGVSLLSFAWRCVIHSAQHRMNLFGAVRLASLAFPWPLAPAPGFQRRLLAALGRAWQ